jgi:hypothetical protein
MGFFHNFHTFYSVEFVFSYFMINYFRTFYRIRIQGCIVKLQVCFTDEQCFVFENFLLCIYFGFDA